MENARTFTDRLAGLLALEHAALGEFLVALADFDRQGLWAELGYSSLFDFLHRELRVSKGAAFYRKTAVSLVQRFPQIVEPLRDGRLCLMTVAEVARVLTPENRGEVLPRFFHLSKREAQALAAALMPNPAPPQREVITPVRAAVLAPALAFTTSGNGSVPNGAVQPVELAAAPAAAPSLAAAIPAAHAVPLTAELNRLHVTVSAGFLEKLEAARDALSHAHPGARMEEILEAGLDLLLERDAKRKALVKKPRTAPRPSPDPEYVPAHVRREVWKRDQGRCQWKLASGGICGSTRRVELDHRIARARGGPPTVENLRCLCRAHNLVAAREAFGDACMDAYTRNPRASEPPGDGSPATSPRRSRRAPPLRAAATTGASP